MISMLLLLSVSSLIIPSASEWMILRMPKVVEYPTPPIPEILAESRGISIIVIFIYMVWLFFTLSTNSSMFTIPTAKAQEKPKSEVGEETIRRLAAIGALTAATSGGGINQEQLHRIPCDTSKEEDLEECSLSLMGATIAMMTSVVLLGFNTQFATDSIQAILQRSNLSQAFLSLIILPLLSNDPLAIKMAIRDRMDMSISLTLERCMQTCLLVLPLTVLLAWCMGVDEMDLNFDVMLLTTLFLSVFIVTLVVRRGRSNWYATAIQRIIASWRQHDSC